MTTPTFTVETFHNPYLPEGGGEVDAIVAVTAAGAGGAAAPAGAHAILVDCSGSMGDPATKIHAARQAVRAALEPHLCRCGAQNRMIRAVLRAARAMLGTAHATGRAAHATSGAGVA